MLAGLSNIVEYDTKFANQSSSSLLSGATATKVAATVTNVDAVMDAAPVVTVDEAAYCTEDTTDDYFPASGVAPGTPEVAEKAPVSVPLPVETELQEQEEVVTITTTIPEVAVSEIPSGVEEAHTQPVNPSTSGTNDLLFDLELSNE